MNMLVKLSAALTDLEDSHVNTAALLEYHSKTAGRHMAQERRVRRRSRQRRA